MKTGASGPDLLQLYSFFIFRYFDMHLFVNFVSKISPELLYLETWNFVHMTSMTTCSCIVGKKIRAMGPGPLELFPFVVLAIKFCIFLNNFYTGFQILMKFILHIHLYALHMWYENRGFRATLLQLNPFLAHLSSAQDELLWSLFVRRPSVLPCVRPLTFSNDFSSETAEPILLKFHMESP